MKRRTTRKNKKSKRNCKRNRTTRKNKSGGMSEKYQQMNAYRTDFINLINRINTNSSRNAIKDFRGNLIRLFGNRNEMINVLIPITETGEPVLFRDISTPNNTKKVYDYVSQIIIIFNNLSNILTQKDLELILNSYFTNGGNFNSLSSRFKLSPFKNELNKQRVVNVRMLLDNANPFHIIEDGLDEETKTELARLIPNEQRIETEPEPEPEPEQVQAPEPVHIVTYPKLQFSYPLPENNEEGYDRAVAPEFWKPIFNNGEQLLQIRDTFTRIYELSKYTTDIERKPNIICNILERIVPSYFTPNALSYGQSPKIFITVNILNCFITLLFGMILSTLYETKQDFLFFFKGGRALQLSLVNIPDIVKYFSEDTDILIMPNKFEGITYDKNKMENFSAHIGYLVKWFIPQDINIMVSLPTNPKNLNKDITKLIYNDNKLFKALSDIGFGEISQDIKKYFDNLLFDNFNIEEFNSLALFIIPTIDDMLSEKLYFFSKYFIFNEKLKKNEPINEIGYTNLTSQECDFYMTKFKRAILKLVEAIMKKDYRDTVGLNTRETSKLILRGIIGNFDDYSNEEKENIIMEIYPNY